MKRALTFVASILAALIIAGTGGYVLWQFHSTPGLIGGVGLVLLGVGIALPIQLREGAATLKANVVLVVPVIVDALKGGGRRTDPPADSEGK
jgi:O-antigen ligase